MRRRTMGAGIVLLLVAALGGVMLIEPRATASAPSMSPRRGGVLARQSAPRRSIRPRGRRKNRYPLTRVGGRGRAHFADHTRELPWERWQGAKTAMGPKFYPRVPTGRGTPPSPRADGSFSRRSRTASGSPECRPGAMHRGVCARELDPRPLHPTTCRDHGRGNRRDGEAQSAAAQPNGHSSRKRRGSSPARRRAAGEASPPAASQPQHH